MVRNLQGKVSDDDWASDRTAVGSSAVYILHSEAGYQNEIMLQHFLLIHQMLNVLNLHRNLK